MVSDKATNCPNCGEILTYYGRVKRKIRIEYGETDWIYISRMVCPYCKTWHRQIPGYILPYKHYRKDIIEGFRTGEKSSDELYFEDYPSEATIRRWLMN